MSYSGLQKGKVDIDKYNRSNTPEAIQAKKAAEENPAVGSIIGGNSMKKKG